MNKFTSGKKDNFLTNMNCIAYSKVKSFNKKALLYFKIDSSLLLINQLVLILCHTQNQHILGATDRRISWSDSLPVMYYLFPGTHCIGIFIVFK